MAKKKKKKGRKSGSRAPRPAPARPQGRPPQRSQPAAGQETRAGRAEQRSEKKDRREEVRRRREAVRRRKRLRYIAGAAALLLAVIGFAAFRVYEGRQAMQEHMVLASGAGCGEIERISDPSSGHVSGGVEYEHNPPVSGAHSASSLPAGVYDEPFSRVPQQQPNLYEAVHSLEHGYIIIWHHDLTEAEERELSIAFRDEEKTIVVPWPELSDAHTGNQMALTAWDRRQVCESADPEVAASFIDLYREETGPEPDAR